jgi:UDP-N-acetylglucosamine:LPS N-acetylglucosamine transferase
MELVNAGAACIIEEKNLSEKILISKIKTLFENPFEIEKIKFNIKKLVKTDEISACEKICQIIEKIVGNK